ncbi:DUF3995 domain-containing protein [Streptomyces sp. NPDC004609]|uniref:DUF3995 domain-containing protein n=1 Tax=Streptomyces sp. NPDC004609 TaxID=3364704 RepID=UPI003683C5C3
MIDADHLPPRRPSPSRSRSTAGVLGEIGPLQGLALVRIISASGICQCGDLALEISLECLRRLPAVRHCGARGRAQNSHKSGHGDKLRSSGSRWHGYLAFGWATIFAGVHFFWALGGEDGLDISAGKQLAVERPDWFVVGGLWAVGFLCLAGALVALGLRRRGVHGRPWTLLKLLGSGIGVLLLVRGIGVETLLITGASGVDGVSSAQKFWTLALWNPWFILGGVLFSLAAWSFGKEMAGE